MIDSPLKPERKTETGERASDPELLRHYAEDHSEAAFAELVSRHVGLVYAAALRQVGGAAHRAQDVAQTVFVALARQAGPLSRRTEIVGWLYTSTHHVAAKLKRTEQRRALREQETHAMNEINADYGAAADWERLRPVLDEAMHGLSEADREAILLRYFQNRRLAEVGQRLGLSEDAARMRLDRALDKLHVLLGRRGITSTTTALGVVLANPLLATAPAGMAASVTGAALAGVAVGAGASSAVTAATIFMNAKTTLITVAAVLAIGFSIYEFNALRGAHAELQAQLQTAQQRVAAAERQSVALRSELEAERAAKLELGFKTTLAGALTPASTPAQAVTAAPANTGGWSLRSMTREEARRRQGENFDTSYLALYRELNLTLEQREQFKNLMLDCEETSSRLLGKAVAEARARNPNFDRADQYEIFEVMNAQTKREQQAAVRQALGETAAQALQKYQATGPVRSVAMQLAAKLAYSEAPLLPAQADQLIEIMARNARGPVGTVELVALNVEATVAQASGLLSPVQLAELRKAADGLVEFAIAERERNTAPAATLKAARE
ncbi:MAG: sigma-70 family RNA polymerase sigma factor [Opitutaceae bacterium]